MSARRARPRAHARREREARIRRARRLALLTLLGSVLLAVSLLTAFSGGGEPQLDPAPAKAARLLPAGTPKPEVVAIYGRLRLQMPIPQSRVTAIGFAPGDQGTLALSPVGTQANRSVFARLWHKLVGGDTPGARWYQLPGGTGAPTSALDVGAAPGTDVYSPVDGTIIGMTDLVLNGKSYGQKIEIQPAEAPSIVVVVSHLAADTSLSVGSAVVAGVSKIGTLLDFSSVERQALAQFTQDSGNHALIEVHPAATLALS